MLWESHSFILQIYLLKARYKWGITPDVENTNSDRVQSLLYSSMLQSDKGSKHDNKE